jgi:hypothetical protein
MTLPVVCRGCFRYNVDQKALRRRLSQKLACCALEGQCEVAACGHLFNKCTQKKAKPV